MAFPERSMQWHPRNKNMVLGMLLEAIYYTQASTGRLDERLLQHINNIFEHCTACGRCASVCPVNIPSGEVAIALRSMVESKGVGGHPVKTRILHWLVTQPQKRIPAAAKMASLGQKTQNKALSLIPQHWVKRFKSPIFSGKGPKMGYTNLYESLKLHRGHIFTPDIIAAQGGEKQLLAPVLYFPGCGGALFHDRIATAGLLLLLKAGHSVIIPPQHNCCGYPLKTAGMEKPYRRNREAVRKMLAQLCSESKELGYDIKYLVTACGTCIESLESIAENLELQHRDVVQLSLESLSPLANLDNAPRLYHEACHVEWPGLHKTKGRAKLLQALTDLSGASFFISSGCCAESGMGAITSPHIFNILRERKAQNLSQALQNYAGPIIVSCPSCKVGIERILENLQLKRSVLHTSQWLAQHLYGPQWLQNFKKQILDTRGAVRKVKM